MEKAWCESCKRLIEDDELIPHMVMGHSILLGFTNKESEKEFLKEIHGLSEKVKGVE